MMPAVSIEGVRMAITFGPGYDLDAYRLFLDVKRLPEREIDFDWRADTYRVTAPARFAARLGITDASLEQERRPLAEHLFDYQRWIVDQALRAQRYAIWADTGLGKTAMFLEWAEQVSAMTHGRVLIISPLQIIEQTRAEHARFYGQIGRIQRIDSREALAAWCLEPDPALGIVNPEKLIAGQLPELRYLAGLVLDESSLLKTGGGTIKWNLIHSAKGIEYKLSCTATPAPNDTMEYASQAAFLEKLRSEGDILWTFFTRDSKTNEWRVKPHARDAFYRFMSSWSVYLRDPAHYGFRDILSTLPPPEMHEYRLELTDDQRTRMVALQVEQGSGLFADKLGIRERAKFSQLAKGFIYVGRDKHVELVESEKPGIVASITADEVAAGRQTIVWTVFDAESEIVSEELSERGVEHATLHGSDSPEQRQVTIDRFKAGAIPALVTKAALVGHGLNFQNCQAMVFSGFDDSFERLYQAIRRAYRFGQTETVHVHIPVLPELEGLVYSNVRAKEAAFMRDVAQQEKNYRAALAGTLAA